VCDEYAPDCKAEHVIIDRWIYTNGDSDELGIIGNPSIKYEQGYVNNVNS
jgi:hypothetical protein